MASGTPDGRAKKKIMVRTLPGKDPDFNMDCGGFDKYIRILLILNDLNGKIELDSRQIKSESIQG